MKLVAEFNEDEYRICAHKKCHLYFKVDKAHPQSMCDAHMAARRRKRRNQREAGYTDYRKYAEDYDFEE